MYTGCLRCSTIDTSSVTSSPSLSRCTILRITYYVEIEKRTITTEKPLDKGFSWKKKMLYTKKHSLHRIKLQLDQHWFAHSRIYLSTWITCNIFCTVTNEQEILNLHQIVYSIRIQSELLSTFQLGEKIIILIKMSSSVPIYMLKPLFK